MFEKNCIVAVSPTVALTATMHLTIKYEFNSEMRHSFLYKHILAFVYRILKQYRNECLFDETSDILLPSKKV